MATFMQKLGRILGDVGGGYGAYQDELERQNQMAWAKAQKEREAQLAEGRFDLSQQQLEEMKRQNLAQEGLSREKFDEMSRQFGVQIEAGKERERGIGDRFTRELESQEKKYKAMLEPKPIAGMDKASVQIQLEQALANATDKVNSGIPITFADIAPIKSMANILGRDVSNELEYLQSQTLGGMTSEAERIRSQSEKARKALGTGRGEKKGMGFSGTFSEALSGSPKYR
jgi:hypothetical protein